MPIKVQCICGKAFAAKDELAGKTVKCPACQKPLKIPTAAPAAQKATQKGPEKATQKRPAKTGSGNKASQGTSDSSVRKVADLFDEAGLQAAAHGTTPCPGCTEPLPSDAVVCIKCGYNMKLGRRMQTVKVGGESGGVIGHGAVAEDLLSKAAQTIDEDAAEEIKKTKEGMPWWVHLIVLILLICLAAYMLLFWHKEEPKEGKDGKKAWLNDRGHLTAPA